MSSYSRICLIHFSALPKTLTLYKENKTEQKVPKYPFFYHSPRYTQKREDALWSFPNRGDIYSTQSVCLCHSWYFAPAVWQQSCSLRVGPDFRELLPVNAPLMDRIVGPCRTRCWVMRDFVSHLTGFSYSDFFVYCLFNALMWFFFLWLSVI